uniref:GUN4-like domain-containing protein n=1 Tax=Sporolithon durum TaxID=48970 RepID=A0A141SD16_9FLOR|nr:hypothetical protein Sdur_138 [Sporolithon durum]AMK96184.1 hypothetical protein Sdur_138 [Sporolithon durum]
MTNKLNIHLIKLKQIAHLVDPISINQQIKLVKDISHYNNKGTLDLLEFLIERRIKSKTPLSYIDGILFKHLYKSKSEEIQKFINENFCRGIVDLNSSFGIDYLPLQNVLLSNNFKSANKYTQMYLCQLAGLNKNNDRKWLYFTDIINLPSEDLNTIDKLWTIYSEGKFGFSIQRQIWLSNNKNWEQLWYRIGWKINNTAIRYPNEFIWDNTAPLGHLPLFNQLRGVQVLYSLFKHPVWETYK